MKTGVETDAGFRGSNEVIAEFRIHGALCLAVPGEQVSDTLALGALATAQIIGSCLPDGQQYLILSNRSANQIGLRTAQPAPAYSPESAPPYRGRFCGRSVGPQRGR